MPLLFCFGFGFSAKAVARDLGVLGYQIAGTSRDPAKVRAMRDTGIDAQIFGPGHPLERPELLGQATAILSSIAPDADGDAVMNHHGQALASTRAWLGYLSTTGVYGDAKGAWVDEGFMRQATSERGMARIKAEDAWHALGAEIFRLAGIYGPGRSQLDGLRQGTAKRVVKPGQVFSRIHVDDIAQVVTAAIRQPHRGAIYNVADDEPAPPQTVVAFAAKLLGIAPPPEETFEAASPHMSPMARSFYADNKRIDNRRIKRDLGLRLLYPTYRQGLSACLSADKSMGR
jgi:nucleoside-diphosphate-sugar epimerase